MIYIVFGATGEYSDHREWVVKAYTKKEAAEEMVTKCTEEGNRIKSKYGVGWNWNHADVPHKYDPGFHWDYSGFNYYIVECELVNE